MLDVPDLDTANGCATREGGVREVVAWQSVTTRLLPRMLAGRKSGPLFLTDRKARPSVATNGIDPGTGRARLSYRRAAELFEAHTAGYTGGPYTLHQLHHSRLMHAAEDGASTPVLMKLSGHTSVSSLAKYARVSDDGLRRYQADSDADGPVRVSAVDREIRSGPVVFRLFGAGVWGGAQRPAVSPDRKMVWRPTSTALSASRS
ncbi:site-specific integrase [Nocardia sp. NPDC023852]|uniref:site-specific integrase n=1 Tax=Nocardia sp. NPDC023852 TaxID=3154697 RepID=UPI0033F966E4